mmetsp:Transcript_6396/g.9648  ORF Transcript_6396/g.9648 Transcript_6396/m.9648 type:complete len:89 (+) Transcript_6396:53-319(+)
MMKYMYLMLMYWWLRLRKRRKQRLLLTLLRIRMTLRERNYLKKHALRPIQKSSWRRLYEHGDDKDFVNITSLTRSSFSKLLLEFEKLK